MSLLGLQEAREIRAYDSHVMTSRATNFLLIFSKRVNISCI